MIYSSPMFIKLRNVTRILRLNKMVATVLSRGGYEDRFGSRMIAEIRPNDTVWDVGANVGLYTEQFAERAAKGRVVAFEPVPACFAVLKQASEGKEAILPVNAALGATDGRISMVLADDALGATHRVVEAGNLEAAAGNAVVPVRSGGNFVVENPELFPNIIKIDVEGFEGAVFAGLRALLDDRRLRCVGVEVHFGLLRERGESQVPKALEDGLKEHGFRVEWTDPSHFIALR